MNWILILFGISWVAVFTSQSLVDLADALFIISGLEISIRHKQVKIFFTGFKPAWFWIAWLVVLFIGLALNADIKSPQVLTDFFEFRWILTFLAVIYLTTKIQDTEKLMKIWLWLSIILNVASLVLYSQAYTHNWRAAGILNQTMSFSHNIAPALCLFSVYLLVNWKALSKNTKALAIVVVFTTALLTLLTFTRGVWLGAGFGLMITLFLWNRRMFSQILLSSVVLVAVLVATNERIQNRVFGRTESESQSNNERIALWKGNWRIIQDHPMFGVGIGQNKFHLRKYYDEFGYPPEQRVSHAHNQYLQMWAGTGTIGFIFFLAFLFLILKHTSNGAKSATGPVLALQLGLLAALICFQVGALTESNFNIAKNRHFFLVLAGVAIGQSIKKKSMNI